MNTKLFAVLFLTLGITLFSISCKKENIDTTNTNGGGGVKTDTTHVNCDSTFWATLTYVDSTSQIFSTVTGGKSPYTYKWSTAATQSYTTVNANTNLYSLTVTDANGCTTVNSITIHNNNPCASLKSAIQIISPIQIKATADGGKPPYSYKWSLGNATTQTLNIGGTKGGYSVTITDANGCTVLDRISNDCIGFNAAILQDSMGIGRLTGIPIAGYYPYTYTWSTGENAQIIQPSTNGTYSLTVTDAFGCKATTQTTISGINPCANLTVSIIWNAVGELVATASGGQAPYFYDWGNNVTGAVRIGVKGTTYTVTVTDAKGCVTTQSITP